MIEYEKPIMTIIILEESEVSTTIVSTSNEYGGETNYEEW